MCKGYGQKPNTLCRPERVFFQGLNQGSFTASVRLSGLGGVLL